MPAGTPDTKSTTSYRITLDEADAKALGHRAVDARLSPTAYATRVIREHLQAPTIVGAGIAGGAR